MTEELTRSARKHQSILGAAAELFLAKGYQGTSMDEVAAKAAVSKQTVYKHFADKETLFGEIIQGTLERVAEPFGEEIRSLAETTDLAHDLHALARQYLVAVLQPQVVQLRRLIIGESGRLPALTRGYYDRAIGGTLTRLADCFARLAERGLLAVDDPRLAAGHFAFLVLGQPLDEAMFADTPAPRELERFADAGARVFLAAYDVSGR
ncbi:TetR/AcrR family transcriptional regulator [Amycolatopsis acidiphila]|uniref:TetR/AcrR family transcriptional regulator n=1 Tax=Amycolatopsis acidiphila TaxID=715473 RepID=A0A557ZYM3_9PSEU|nr:TetR/AcrR family transcriptional regulator [Amycolatopsis acidiphila]TVT17094.1 TetR/AcrR family transcriptional regulator [Amycolatopsis acidiphila]UIJ61962.1 TetR/AcrR family transcriptional regulator [Amycolatopsis acidiphila]GHG56883.1 TetR family transcriptional regulator [Amycolatopsis acidiphila]